MQEESWRQSSSNGFDMFLFSENRHPYILCFIIIIIIITIIIIIIIPIRMAIWGVTSPIFRHALLGDVLVTW